VGRLKVVAVDRPPAPARLGHEAGTRVAGHWGHATGSRVQLASFVQNPVVWGDSTRVLRAVVAGRCSSPRCQSGTRRPAPAPAAKLCSIMVHPPRDPGCGRRTGSVSLCAVVWTLSVRGRLRALTVADGCLSFGDIRTVGIAWPTPWPGRTLSGCWGGDQRRVGGCLRAGRPISWSGGARARGAAVAVSLRYESPLRP
jgi:hypothetical protein